MNCRDFLQHFSSYLEGELGERTLAETEAHLDRCEKCARRVAAYRQGIEHLHQSPIIEPPTDLYFRVKRALSSFPGSISLKPRKLRFLIPAAAAAIIVLAVTAGLIDTRDESRFAYEIGTADSTLDVVNLQAERRVPVSYDVNADRQSGIVRLASYASIEDEPAFSYPVYTRPVIVLSGVSRAGD